MKSRALFFTLLFLSLFKGSIFSSPKDSFKKEPIREKELSKKRPFFYKAKNWLYLGLAALACSTIYFLSQERETEKKPQDFKSLSQKKAGPMHNVDPNIKKESLDPFSSDITVLSQIGAECGCHTLFSIYCSILKVEQSQPLFNSFFKGITNRNWVSEDQIRNVSQQISENLFEQFPEKFSEEKKGLPLNNYCPEFDSQYLNFSHTPEFEGGVGLVIADYEAFCNELTKNLDQNFKPDFNNPHPDCYANSCAFCTQKFVKEHLLNKNLIAFGIHVGVESQEELTKNFGSSEKPEKKGLISWFKSFFLNTLGGSACTNQGHWVSFNYNPKETEPKKFSKILDSLGSSSYTKEAEEAREKIVTAIEEFGKRNPN